MDGKNTPKSALEPNKFEIPIKEFEDIINSEAMKGKKSEILNLLKNHNEISSYSEFDEIRTQLKNTLGDLELLEILLSKKIEDDTKWMSFKINKAKKEASLFGVTNSFKSIIVPRSIQCDSEEYLVTSICRCGENTCLPKSVKTLHFDDQSAVHTIYGTLFENSNIENLQIPASLVELKDGWCFNAMHLKSIEISPLNDRFVYKDNKYLLGKTDPNNNEFDILLFARNDVEEVEIPSNIKIIGSHSFSNCANLKKVEFPTDSKLEIINSYAFARTKIERISIPSSVKKICRNVFANCVRLKDVEIPENSNLQRIEKFAFAGSNINQIYFPKSLIELEEQCLYDTQNLEIIEVSPMNDRFMCKDNEYLLGKTDPKSDEFDILLFVSKVEEIKIPSNIKIIGPFAFSDNPIFQKVEFAEDSKLEIIGRNSFSGTNINEISIPKTVSMICDHAFGCCFNLYKVDIPADSNLQIIGEKAFDNTSINEIYIPPSVLHIKNLAFSSCWNLHKVYLSENSNLQTIGNDSFARSIIENFYITKNLVEFKEGWFNNQENFKTSEVSPLNDRFIYKDDKYLLGKTDPNNNEFDIILFVKNDVEEIKIPSNIKVIESFSFTNCFNLKKVEFSPDSKLEIIGESAFAGTKIEQIYIPSSVTSICKRAFENCIYLEKVDIQMNSKLQIIDKFAFQHTKIVDFFIPPNITKISLHSFYLCNQLKKVEIPENSKLHTIEGDAFGNSKIEQFYIPKSVIQLDEKCFSNMENLSRFDISPLNNRFIYKDNKYLLGKTNPNNDEFDVLLLVGSDVSEAKISSNIKVIGYQAFYNCRKLENVEFAEDSKLEIIDNCSFIISSIKKISIPSSVTKIGKFAFSHCKNLQTVELLENSSLKIIEDMSFAFANVSQIYIPSNVKKIDHCAFSYSKNLKIIEFANKEILDLLDFHLSESIILMVPFKNK